MGYRWYSKRDIRIFVVVRIYHVLRKVTAKLRKTCLGRKGQTMKHNKVKLPETWGKISNKPKYWVEIARPVSGDPVYRWVILGYRKRASVNSRWFPHLSRCRKDALDFCRATGLELREGKK